jgi:hypothetical protein
MVELEDALVAPGPPAEICRSVKMKGNSYPLATKQEPYAVDQQPPRRMRTGPGCLRRALWGDGEWWSEEAEKSVSKGAVQAPFETLLGGIHSTELVRRASSRDMRVSRREEDYGGGRRVKVGWMKLPQMVKLNMHRRETRSLKSRRGAFLRQSSTFFERLRAESEQNTTHRDSGKDLVRVSTRLVPVRDRGAPPALAGLLSSTD